MIVTHDLSKKFDDVLAVDGITLKIGVGEILALLGPNGAGKTTTVRMLTSVLRPTRGWARVAGYDVVKQATQVRRAVGVLTEQHGLYHRMAADEYLDFFARVYDLRPQVRQQRIRRLLEDFGLWEHRSRRIGEYSKGMRQKLALARALVHDPAVLLLDEPTSAMDPESARLVRDAIRALRSAERTIVVCTHNLAEAEELADQIAILRQGRIIACGTPSELKVNLLGPVEYELRLACELVNGWEALLPPGTRLTGCGESWIRYQAQEPARINPWLLRRFLDQGLEVVSLQEVPRSLEQAYLQAVHTLEGIEVRDGLAG